LLHLALRRLPGTRNVYAQRDALAEALAAAQARPNPPPAAAPPLAQGRHARLVEEGGLGAVAGVLLHIARDGPLGARGDTLLLPFDDAMYPMVVRDRAWQAEELDFLRAKADPGTRYALLDIGANIGLFARQAQRTIANIGHIACVEADPRNFAALACNLAHLPRGAVALHNVALADRPGRLTWYRDLENFGNYSLNADAMRGRPCSTLSVEAVEAGAFFAEHPPPAGARIIWKSDTQGYDEAIISRVPDALWDRVDLAIVELWRIDKPAFDEDEFRRRIAAFPHRGIGSTRNQVSVEDVMEYLAGRDYAYSDLYLWR
jgi:FkbM family methyltransferase